MKKRLIVLSMISCIILGGCGSDKPATEQTDSSTTAASTEAKTIAKAESVTEKKTESSVSELNLTEEEARCRDRQTAFIVYDAATEALSNKDAFNSVKQIAGNNGIGIESTDSNGIDFNIPEQYKIDAFQQEFEKKLKVRTLPMFYYNMEWKPVQWGIYIDKNYKVHVHTINTEGNAVEVYPDTDSWYQYGSKDERQNKADDIESATKIGLEVQNTWKDDASIDDIFSYITPEGTVIAAAKPGEPFQSLVDSPINVFLGNLNGKLGGKAPVMRYIGDVNGVMTLEWGILV